MLTLKYFDGFSHVERHFDKMTYTQVANIARAFPPSFIWHIE